jgi:hypothetical protein
MSDPLPSKIKLNHCSRTVLLILVVALVVALTSPHLRAQGNSNPGPDVIVFANGERLVGHFESFSGGMAKFKSDTLGKIDVDLGKVQEFHSTQKFAVIEKNLKLGKGKVDGQIPQGTISVANQKVEINPGNGQPARTVAVGDLNNIIDQASFERALHRRGIFEDWKGAIAFGSSIVESTQNSLNFNTAVSLVRAIPSENWLAPSNRTIVDFSDSYGKVTQAGSPTLKTSIYHADAERDEYFTRQLYAFAAAAVDHNSSQGLDLQQMYGGGMGWTVIQKAKQSLDLKGSIDFEKQAFQAPAQHKNLAGSVFTESYNLKFANNIVIKQILSASPAWTETRAYSAYGGIGITLPVYKRFGFNANFIDSYLNDPPPAFKKNSIQLTTGLSYTLP